MLCMQREQQERQDIMGALDRERQAAIEGKRLAEKQHLAALQAERDHKSALSEKLMQTQVPSIDMFPQPFVCSSLVYVVAEPTVACLTFDGINAYISKVLPSAVLFIGIFVSASLE